MAKFLTSKNNNAKKLKLKLASLGLKASVKSPTAKSSHYFNIAPVKRNGKYEFNDDEMKILIDYLKSVDAHNVWGDKIDFDAAFVTIYATQTTPVYLPANTNLEVN